MPNYLFSGEESARFARFAQACLAISAIPRAEVSGREPLTSRPISIDGVVVGAKLDGYIRYIVVRDRNSEIEYWVGGSNSTRSIAAKSINISLSESESTLLEEFGSTTPQHVPRIRRIGSEDDDVLWEIENSLHQIDARSLQFLLNSLTNNNPCITLEAALTLRAFSGFVVESGRRQQQTESSILDAIDNALNWETKAALVEDLGYIATPSAIPKLTALLCANGEHDHVRWAAAIALGRLPEVSPTECLVGGLTSHHEWTRAATLLSCARQVNGDSTKVADLFTAYLGAAHSPLMNRYACLGLSKLSTFSSQAISSLAAVLGDDELPVSVRGYAALAISAGLSSIEVRFVNEIREILGRFARFPAIDSKEPEAIWGIEYLAELASLLEINDVSSSLHSVIAEHFDDWRSDYYTCMKYYERAEASVRRGLGDDAINSYQCAISELKPIIASSNERELPPEARATIEFRLDIVSSRQKIQSLLGIWLASANKADLPYVSKELRPIRDTYRKYSIVGPDIGRDRQLIAREVAYLRNTTDLVEVISALVDLDFDIRGASSLDSELGHLLVSAQQLSETAESLEEKFAANFAQSLTEVIKIVRSSLREIEDGLRSKNIDPPDKLRLARKAMTQIRSSFWRASWPMPARACPVYGLGRASISLRADGISGLGTEQDPYIYPRNSPVVIFVRIQMFEMAPGGSSTVRLIYDFGGQKVVTIVPIVEDQYTCTIHIRELIPSYTAVPLDCALVFSARDCEQQADCRRVYLRCD
jgi:hypothetical protein